VLGATLKVDMKYTHRMDVCRVLVGVTDLDDIPDATDIVVGGVYEFFSKIDKVCKDGSWIEYHGPDNSDNDGEGEKESFDDEDTLDDEGANEGSADDDVNMVEATKEEAQKENPPHAKEAMEQKIQDMAQEILNRAMDFLIEETADRVLAESSDLEDLQAQDSTNLETTGGHGNAVKKLMTEQAEQGLTSTNEHLAAHEHEFQQEKSLVVLQPLDAGYAKGCGEKPISAAVLDGTMLLPSLRSELAQDPASCTGFQTSPEPTLGEWLLPSVASASSSELLDTAPRTLQDAASEDTMLIQMLQLSSDKATDEETDPAQNVITIAAPNQISPAASDVTPQPSEVPENKAAASAALCDQIINDDAPMLSRAEVAGHLGPRGEQSFERGLPIARLRQHKILHCPLRLCMTRHLKFWRKLQVKHKVKMVCLICKPFLARFCRKCAKETTYTPT
jgi:hypothetical protein